MQKRRRFKQTTSLQDRIAKFQRTSASKLTTRPIGVPRKRFLKSFVLPIPPPISTVNCPPGDAENSALPECNLFPGSAQAASVTRRATMIATTVRKNLPITSCRPERPSGPVDAACGQAVSSEQSVHAPCLEAVPHRAPLA